MGEKIWLRWGNVHRFKKWRWVPHGGRWVDCNAVESKQFNALMA